MPLPRISSSNFPTSTEVEATCNSHCIGLVKLMGSGHPEASSCRMGRFIIDLGLKMGYATNDQGFISILWEKVMGEEWILMGIWEAYFQTEPSSPGRHCGFIALHATLATRRGPQGEGVA